MDIAGLLLATTSKSVAKIILKKFLETAGVDGVLGEDLVDIVAEHIDGKAEQRKAERVFEGMADHVVTRLAPLFENAVKRGEVTVDAVANELRLTLESRVSADCFIGGDLDASKLAKAFRESRPLPRGQFSSSEIELYERALDLTVRCIADVADQLPKFDSKLAAMQLQRISRLQEDLSRTLSSVERIESLMAMGELRS